MLCAPLSRPLSSSGRLLRCCRCSCNSASSGDASRSRPTHHRRPTELPHRADNPQHIALAASHTVYQAQGRSDGFRMRPRHLSSLLPGHCQPVLTVTGRLNLRSADRGDLVVPRTTGKRYGHRSFRSSAPIIWNELPAQLHSRDISNG
jgi:hypothetical protein